MLAITPGPLAPPIGWKTQTCLDAPRFSAYASVLLGAQALWWEGMGACAGVGTGKFGLVASINQRVSQWAEPLLMRKAYEVPPGLPLIAPLETQRLNACLAI